MDETSLKKLLSDSQSADPLVRGRAVESLAEIKSEAAEACLKSLVLDSDYMVRFKAAMELAWLGDDASVAMLVSALDRKDLCFMALEALCELSSEKALRDVQRFFSKWGLHPLEKLQAAAGLHCMGDKRGSDFLVLKLESSQPEERGFALELWGRLGMPHALDLLMGVLSDPNNDFRLDAIRGLAWLSDAKCLPLLDQVCSHTDDELLTDMVAELAKRLRDL